MITDATLFLHGTGTSAFGAFSLSGSTYGDALCRAGSQYSNLEIDFGAPGSASSWPYVSQFPSYTEEGYPGSGYSLAETFDTGVPWGLHIQIMSTFNTLTSINFQICTSAATSAVYTGAGNPIASRTLTSTQLQVLGGCYFIPVTLSQVQEFTNFYASLTGGSPTTGTVVSWFGPKSGGTL